MSRSVFRACVHIPSSASIPSPRIELRSISVQCPSSGLGAPPGCTHAPQWHFAHGAVLLAPCLRSCKLLQVGKLVPLSHVPDPSRSSTKNVLKGFANDKGIHLTFIEHQLCTKPCAKPCRGLYNAKPLGSRLPKELQTRQCSRESFCTCQGHRGLPQGTLPGTRVC